MTMTQVAELILNNAKNEETSQNFVVELDSEGAERRRFTYQELPAILDIIYANLSVLPVKPGGLVMLICDQQLDTLLLACACIRSGFQFTVFAHPSPKLSMGRFAETLAPAVQTLKPEYIISIGAFSDAIAKVASIPVVELTSIDPAACVAGAPPAMDWSTPKAASPLFYQFSSGTTGLKKAVLIEGDALIHQLDAYEAAIDLGPKDVIVNWLPYYHDMGLITGLLMPVLKGINLVTMSPFDWIARPALFLQAVSTYQGSLAWLPNFAFLLLANKLPKGAEADLDLSSLRALVNCSEPVTHSAFQSFTKRYAEVGLDPSVSAVSYAMAETTFAVTSNGVGAPLRTVEFDPEHCAPGQMLKPGSRTAVSNGPPIEGTEVTVQDTEGRPCEERQFGEIVVSSSSMMTAYTDRERTEQRLAPNGFLTGDLGFIDQGELFVLGRIDDQMIIAGRNFFPEDVEFIVSRIQGIVPGRVMCFGVFDETQGTQNAVVVAECEEEWSSAPALLEREIRSRIVSDLNLTLAAVLILNKNSLTKTSSGKIPRNEVRRRFLDGELDGLLAIAEPAVSSEEDLNDPVLSQVLDIYREVSGRTTLGPDDNVLTTGLMDSLGLVNVLVKLEETFHRQMPHPEKIGYDGFDSPRQAAAIVNNPIEDDVAPPRQALTDRQIKIGTFLGQEHRFNGFIIGSSRSYGFKPMSAAHTGAKFFNMSVAALRTEELFAISQFILERNQAKPALVFIGLDPESFSSEFPMDNRFVNCEEWFNHLPLKDRQGLGELELVHVDPNSKEQRFHNGMRFSDWDADWEFDNSDGGLARLAHLKLPDDAPKVFQPKLEVGPHIKLLSQKLSSGPLPARLQYFAETLRSFADNGVKVISYDHPWQSFILKQIPEYRDAVEALWPTLETLQSPHYMHFRSLTPNMFEGSDFDFFDRRHMACHNFRLLSEAAWAEAVRLNGWTC